MTEENMKIKVNNNCILKTIVYNTSHTYQITIVYWKQSKEAEI